MSNHYELYGKKWYEKNKETELKRSKEYYKKSGKEKKSTHYKTTRRNATLVSRYGITEEDFNHLFAKQKGVCAICAKEYHLTLHVDHCHSSGVVRGLLCNNCNRGLGHFKDSIETLRKAINYLEIGGKGGSCGV